MGYTALYRKFRPTKFSEIVGQDHITKTIKNQIIAGRVGHAYLFNGGRGTGKTSAAKILARAINCLNPKEGEPCNECEICKATLEGSLTDIVEMDAASNNSVEDVREIREAVNFLPTKAKYRVYIIDEVHMLTTQAFNALLKTLEEPPKHIIFIFATTEPQKLPQTILSRCQRFDYKKVSNDEIVRRLKYIAEKENINIDEESLYEIANTNNSNTKAKKRQHKKNKSQEEVKTIYSNKPKKLKMNFSNDQYNDNSEDSDIILNKIEKKITKLFKKKR
jgi:DNA polymerase-3 subunit gamma/tau